MTAEEVKQLITKISISGQIRNIGVLASNVIIEKGESQSESLTEKLNDIDSAISNILNKNISESIKKSDIYVEDETLIVDNNEEII